MHQQAGDKVTQSGFITLVSVLIISGIGVAIATSLLMLGLGFSRSAGTLSTSEQAKALANSCAEEGLYQIKVSLSFATTAGSITALAGGSCQYSVINSGGITRTVYATGTRDTLVRKVRVAVNQIAPRILITSWQEIP